MRWFHKLWLLLFLLPSGLLALENPAWYHHPAGLIAGSGGAGEYHTSWPGAVDYNPSLSAYQSSDLRIHAILSWGFNSQFWSLYGKLRQEGKVSNDLISLEHIGTRDIYKLTMTGSGRAAVGVSLRHYAFGIESWGNFQTDPQASALALPLLRSQFVGGYQMSASTAWSFMDWAVGLRMRFMSLDRVWDARHYVEYIYFRWHDISQHGGWGLGGDLGVSYRASDRAMWGVSVTDIFGTPLHLGEPDPQGNKTLLLPANWRIGGSASWPLEVLGSDSIVASVALDDLAGLYLPTTYHRVHAGASLIWVRSLTLSVGVNQGYPAVGAAYRYGPVQLSYDFYGQELSLRPGGWDNWCHLISLTVDFPEEVPALVEKAPPPPDTTTQRQAPPLPKRGASRPPPRPHR